MSSQLYVLQTFFNNINQWSTNQKNETVKAGHNTLVHLLNRTLQLYIMKVTGGTAWDNQIQKTLMYSTHLVHFHSFLRENKKVNYIHSEFIKTVTLMDKNEKWKKYINSYSDIAVVKIRNNR